MEKLLQSVENYTDVMLKAEEYIWKNPETGYKEYKTNKYMIEQFKSLGYDVIAPNDITGFYTTIDTGKKGPTVLILAELDSVICASHPSADPITGAVHACGHHCQCSALLGIAGALKQDGVLDDLCGKIKLCAVPAEELLEIEYRTELIKKGDIKYFGGKTEFLSRGYFDDVDVAFMVHTGKGYTVLDGHIGCIAKKIVYKGKSAHAGGSPWLGKNALYAATCGINAVNAIRETFIDSDMIRFHPIITNGGQIVNAIPETVCIESYVRGKTYDALVKANKRVNQALIGSALSLNNNIEILDYPGYSPEVNDTGMNDLARQAIKMALDIDCYVGGTSSGSTDMGDLSVVMPTVQFFSAGATGTSHGNDYKIVDVKKATVDSAKVQCALLYLLLKDDAKKLYDIKSKYTPVYPSIKAYLDYIDKIFSSGDRIIYNENNVEVIL